MARANLSTSARISGISRTLTAKPCRRALRRLLALPAAVRGPRLWRPLLLFETIWRSEVMVYERRDRLAGRGGSGEYRSSDRSVSVALPDDVLGLKRGLGFVERMRATLTLAAGQLERDAPGEPSLPPDPGVDALPISRSPSKTSWASSCHEPEMRGTLARRRTTLTNRILVSIRGRASALPRSVPRDAPGHRRDYCVLRTKTRSSCSLEPPTG
jgi:hypothetical protein